MPRRRPEQLTYDLFAAEDSELRDKPELNWPEAGRFPLNLDRYHVHDVVWYDLKESSAPLIVTGYAGLNQIIDFIADTDESQNVRVLLGYEPYTAYRESWRVKDYTFPEEAENFWLNRGISLLLSAKVVLCKERLKSGRLSTRYIGGNERLHAKIFVADKAATVGSSNFTLPGLKSNLEANTRFLASKESTRYKQTQQIAENYWDLGRDYNAELLELLDKLLNVVSWQEALARACAELLEGEWAERYLRESGLSNEGMLWPSQKQGVAQALYILSRQDSVLIADATGSGKTRMGTHLVNAISDEILRSGRMRYGKSLMICPPAVMGSWRNESNISVTDIDIYSHGILSFTHSLQHELMIQALRRAQVLCVDEGHNFLNIKSNRTRELLRNMADHVILFTATPINKSVLDLLRIVDMLGADNLAPETLSMFKKLLGKKTIKHSFTEVETKQLRAEIRRFTVRRTKRMLNVLIDREPEAYRDHRGELCRFPKHKAKIYPLNESTTDRAIAAQIRALADQITGVTHFVRTLEMPKSLQQMGVSEERYLEGRLVSAKHLSRYIIMSCLRSSRLALAEHISGTSRAAKYFKLKGFTKSTATGNILSVLERIAGHIPENRLQVELPDWLTDPDLHRKQCDQDREIYEKIFRLCAKLSNQREITKARQLIKLSKRHKLLIAFDSHLITLAEINRQINDQGKGLETIVATGEKQSKRKDLLDWFRPGSSKEGVIGLCSDSLSEGVNLQQASLVMHLDMPSVVRIAEQRVGRVDRMDSPHKSIEAWWPQDAPEFALSTDERFVERHETVENLLGSNLPLPTELKNNSSSVSAKAMIKEYEESSDPADWDGISDAFDGVRSLIEGKQAIVPDDIYAHYRKNKTRVLSRVSLVVSSTPWAFFCISAGIMGAPRWVFFPSFNGEPDTELDTVVSHLRKNLTTDTRSLMSLDDKASRTLNTFVGRLAHAERDLLSQKKRRALDEMEKVIKKYLKIAAMECNQYEVEHLSKIIGILVKPLPDQQPDWDEVAARWLDIIRPIWYERLNRPRSRPLLLRDIFKDLIAAKTDLSPIIIEQFKSFPVLAPTEERVLACIIGVS